MVIFLLIAVVFIMPVHRCTVPNLARGYAEKLKTVKPLKRSSKETPPSPRYGVANIVVCSTNISRPHRHRPGRIASNGLDWSCSQTHSATRRVRHDCETILTADYADN